MYKPFICFFGVTFHVFHVGEFVALANSEDHVVHDFNTELSAGNTSTYFISELRARVGWRIILFATAH
jgi:hypothetical protein